VHDLRGDIRPPAVSSSIGALDDLDGPFDARPKARAGGAVIGKRLFDLFMRTTFGLAAGPPLALQVLQTIA